MSRTFLYLIGLPGSGKSTLVRTVLDGVPAIPVADGPVPHITYWDAAHTEVKLVQLGRMRAVFGGTDALGMSIQPKAVWLLDNWIYGDVPCIAEGDRLGNATFFAAVREMGWQLQVVYLQVPTALAQERANQRGSRYTAVWYKGRITKISNLVKAEKPLVLDGTKPVAELASLLRQQPAFAGLRADV
jgi:hypothetical protein